MLHTLLSTCVIPPSEDSFTGDPKRYVKELYQERHKNVLQEGLSLPIGAPLVNLKGICLPGLFERKG